MDIKEKIALKVAELHNLVMEIQEDLEDIYHDSDDEDEIDFYYEIIDAIDSIEAEAGELDCELNNY